MKTIISILILITNYILFSQKTPCYQQKRVADTRKIANCNELVSFDENTDTYYSKKDFTLLYSGKCVSCYRNGQIKSEITILNGKQDSIGIEYFESGCIQSKLFYISGKLEREALFYFDSTGNKAQIENFKNGIRNGKSIQLENNSTNDTLEFTTYRENKLDGIKKEFYPNNKVHRIIEYKNGLQNGIQKSYSKDGKVELEIAFQEGKKHGVWRYYFSSGKEATIQNWKAGLKNGEFKTLDEKGLVIMQQFYNKNISIDTHIENYPDGKTKHIIVFDKKGIKIEEYSFDEFGVKKEIIKRIEKDKKKKDIKKD
jgi:antitoxin component YwqK of YwqJK toxin-antitoxin module